jgi:dipeptidyl aminopeptidase/acylaminoacyl peptidase
VDWFGPTDFLTMGKNEIDHDAADSPESQLIGGPIQEKREKTATSSPIGYVTPDDPPFLIMHGDKDNLVPLAQSEGLHEALRKAGVDSTLQVLPNQRYGFRGVDVQTPVEEFFQKHLKASK